MRFKKGIAGFAAVLLLGGGLAWGAEVYKPRVTNTGTIGASSRYWGAGYFKTVNINGVEYTWPSTNGNASQYLQTDGSGALSWATGADGATTLDTAYDLGGAGVGRAITTDSGPVALSNTDADNAFQFTINATPGSTAAAGGAQITIGANSTQDALEFANSGSGYDIYGTSGTWTVSKAGAGVFGALSSTGTTTLGNGTGTVQVASSTWAVSTAGAFSGVASMGLTGDATFATAKGIKSSTTTAETVLIQGYDVDNTTYRPMFSITNGNTIAGALGDGLETLAIDTTTWDVSTAGAFTGIADITGTAGEAFGITLASDGAADDLTISVTGATDSSVILSSTGTGEDAISLQASAGGVDVDAAAGKDASIAGGQVALVSKDNAASAISLTANVGTTETIVVTNSQGTSESAITLLSTAGGVNVDAAAAKDLDLAGGQVKLVSKDNAASAISLTANIGTSETIVVTNTQGTSESAITLVSTAGGVDVDAAAAKDVNIAGGQVALVSKDNAASAIALTANIGASETIVVTNTQGTGAGAITLTSTAGGITLNANFGLMVSRHSFKTYSQATDTFPALVDPSVSETMELFAPSRCKANFAIPTSENAIVSPCGVRRE